MILRPLLTLLAAVWLAAATSNQRQPIRSLGRIDDSIIRTATHRVNALSQFDLEFDVPHIQRRIRLSLEPNHDVLANGATVNYVNSDGELLRSEPIQRHEHKVFKGTARAKRDDGSWANVGLARITIRKDGLNPLFDGTFAIWHDSHHILLKSNYVRTRQVRDPEIETGDEEYMVIFRDSDLGPVVDASLQYTELKRSTEDYMCQAAPLSNTWQPNAGLFKREEPEYWGMSPVANLFGKRQIDTPPANGNTGGVDLSSTIGQTAGCPTTRKVALVGVATDCGFAQQFSSQQTIRENVISVMNSASGAFESSFNISLGLQNLTVMDANCPGTPSAAIPWNQACNTAYNISDRLNDFSSWRNTLQGNNSHWSLLTSCNDGSAVGLAWVGTACIPGTTGAAVQQGSQNAAGANVVALTGGTEWQVLAHETGHTFGAVHDCDSQTCADSSFVASGQCCPLSASSCNADSHYIMNPYTISGVTTFSPCTVGNICSAIGRNAVSTTCLSDNRDVSTITGQQCGNGIVEAGEDCDCGDATSCASDNCCDGTTCKFKNNAVCDDANEDCCTSCQFATNGTVCRASTSSCDPAETCSGTSSTCPPDVTAPDGQKCNISDTPAGAGQLTCASGQCTSRNLQCISVMGSYTSGSNDTYACDDTTCTMSCGSPAFGPNTCYQMQQNLLDGTQCGGGGHCLSGVCKGSSTAKEIGNWIDDHKGVVIGIASALGVLLILAILSCCCGCYKRRRNNKRMLTGGPMSGNAPMGPNVAGWYGPPPHNPQMQQQSPLVPPHMSFYGQQPAPRREVQPPGSFSGGTDSNGQVRGENPANVGWRPPPSRTQSPAMSGALQQQPQRLYGGGILGSGEEHPDMGVWPEPPPPAYYHGGGSASMRYA